MRTQLPESGDRTAARGVKNGSRRGRPREWVDVEMFELEDAGKPAARERPWWSGVDATRTKYEVICPGHLHRVGIILDPDGHLAYRNHQLHLGEHNAIPCTNSLVRVCDRPPAGRPEVMCKHAREGRP